MKQSRGHMVDLLFALALFCMFAALALAVVLTGAHVYQNTVAGMEQNFTLRTALSYVSEKVRQNDVAGGIHLDTLDGCDALVLEQAYDGAVYQTWIYYYGGSLCELYARKDSGAGAENGQQIMDIAGFLIKQDEGLFTFTVTDSGGRSESVTVAPRCG